MRALRQFHLYLGTIFAPMLIFFVVTGTWQTFGLHRARKAGSYVATPQIVEMSRLHMSAKQVPIDGPPLVAPRSFRYFVLAMGVGFVTTSVLGVIMAFSVARSKWLVGAALAAGILFPAWVVYG